MIKPKVGDIGSLIKVGDIISLIKVTNPYVPKDAKVKVIKKITTKREEYLVVEYNNERYLTHYDNIKTIREGKERIEFT